MTTHTFGDSFAAMEPAHLQEIALSIAGARSLPETLRAIVDALVAMPETALARIWLRAPGDICETCAMRAECPNQTECLHLVASAGEPRESSARVWERLDGDFSRFPLGVRKVGRIAAERNAVLHCRVREGDSWLAHPDWGRAEAIDSFAGQPLVFAGEILGVLAMFCRAQVSEDDLAWLRTLADHAAVAIANARAYDEIDALRRRLELQRDYLRDQTRPDSILGSSDALRTALNAVERVGPTDATVLIEGESGTGKELFAEAVHNRSARRDHALVRVNCAAVPKELFESEFFGHVKGSFTGATAHRAGRFEIADGSTLFLDEVGEIPLELQSKLLRVLQEGTFERIGDNKSRKVDVRIVAATNRDLKREVAAARFREDLYYRLNIFPIRLPPLRERAKDIPELAERFAAAAAERFRKPEPRIDGAQMRALQQYSWPGNVRELQSVIDRAVILADDSRLPLELALPELRGSRTVAAHSEVGDDCMYVTDEVMRARERANTIAALEHAQWKVYGASGAAALLGINPSTLASRMRALGIDKREPTTRTPETAG